MVPILLKYKNLLQVMIQHMFWEMHHPNILQEFQAYDNFVMRDSFALIKTSASMVVQEICDVKNNEAGTSPTVC